MARYTFFNGDFMEEEKTLLSFRDLSVQRGYGVFDFLKIKDGRPLFADEHLARFFASAFTMHLAVPYGREELKKIICDLLQKNECRDGGIRLTLTGGESPDGYSIGRPNLIVSVHSVSTPGESAFENGIALSTFPYQRPIPQAKTIDYTMGIWLQPVLKKNKTNDVLYHHNGIISECPRANVFFVMEGRLITPARNVLEGITRKKVLQCAAEENIAVEEGDVHLTMLPACTEAFITSTTKTILPVARIDQQIFPPQRALTGQLRKRLGQHMTIAST